MPATNSAPRPNEINLTAFSHIISIYPKVLEAFYKDKVKGDESKRKEALEDDIWRYETLPAEMQQEGEKTGLTKEQLERLVKWKITHQTNRPFLLPQIRKNEPKAVEKCTAEAHALLLEQRASASNDGAIKPWFPARENAQKPLDKVCELSGVGPATGTLLLSIFDPHAYPFFEDELHAWLFPNGGKLKYNTKEYFQILDELPRAVSQEIKSHSGSLAIVAGFEKIAFVCEHWNYIEDSEKEKIAQAVQGHALEQEPVEHTAKPVDEAKDTAKVSASKVQTAISAVKKKRVEGDNDGSVSTRKSKRMKK